MGEANQRRPATGGLVVAIDGPAGAGKSTAARRLARHLGYTLLDTGAIYRSLALLARRRGASWDDAAALTALAADLSIEFVLEGDINRVFLEGQEVTVDIRSPEMSEGASRVSALAGVRGALLGLQRRLGARGGVVVEGRDVGTVVFPHAGAKFYLTASPEERARRRVAELAAVGRPVDAEGTRRDMEIRDRRDSTRAVAPLAQAEDAVTIDSTALDAEAVTDLMAGVVRARGG